MVYLLEPVNCPYAPEEPMVTPLGFTSPIRFPPGTDALKREFKPVPPDLVPRQIDVGGDRLMPDFFYMRLDHYYVSSRFRSVLDQYAPGQIEYIEAELTMPAHKNPADAYYFVNILGRSQLMNWELTPKRKRLEIYFWDGPPDKWVMRPPPPDHVAVWHETHRIDNGAKFYGRGTDVFVTDKLGHALNAAFPNQCRIRHIAESPA